MTFKIYWFIPLPESIISILMLLENILDWWTNICTNPNLVLLYEFSIKLVRMWLK